MSHDICFTNVWIIVGADRILKRQKRKTFIGLVCTFYSTLGGMKAVLMTDLFQVNQTTDIQEVKS